MQEVQFDYGRPIEVRTRDLPHWRQDGATYFVTFRLGDSIPEAKLREWRFEREVWLNARAVRELTEADWVEYHRLFSQRINDWLDAGEGSCALRNPPCAAAVGGVLRFADGKDYDLDEWVVMPNHVHVLVTPRGTRDLSDIARNWKSFSARQINALCGTHGQVWQHEPYDHIVRSDKELDFTRRYIRQNPEKARVQVTQASWLPPE